MIFSKKTILIISPERWGTNQLSKHHYAIALAGRGNQVYFLNPPAAGFSSVKITHTDIDGLKLVDYTPSIRGLNSLLPFSTLFKLLISLDINKILRAIAIQPDIVWSFDPFRFQNLKLFKAPLTIFHPVDFFSSKIDQIPARTADIIFSVAQPILDRYAKIKTPAFLINHGVSPVYFKEKKKINKSDSVIRCGYVGNLLSFGIHWENLEQIISENPTIEFHFIGPLIENNLGATQGSKIYLDEIRRHNNVIFYGALPPGEVAKRIQYFDLFLICYNPELVGNVVSNSHKILEYLSTGKVVVSSYMSAYNDRAKGLFEMVAESSQLPVTFKHVVANISVYNLDEHQAKRFEFAEANRYENHIKTIERLVSDYIESTGSATVD
jgi:glycosyltransferase involved in cell wall biosynthesis